MTVVKWLAAIMGGSLVCACATVDQRIADVEQMREANKTLVRRYYEQVVSGGRVEAIRAFISPDYEEVHDGTRYRLGIEGATKHLLGVRRTYPDLRITVERQIAEGDWVATVVTARGTHRGVWMGMMPTGRPVRISAVNIDRVKDDLIVEHGGAANLLGPLLEIGAIQVSQPVSHETSGKSERQSFSDPTESDR